MSLTIEETAKSFVDSFSEPERVEAEVVSDGVKPSQPMEEAEPERTYERVDAEKAEESFTESTKTASSASFDAEQGPIGYSISSLVCGILGLLCCCCGFFGFIFSAAAIALGIISLNKNCEGKGMAIAGIACGGVGAFFFIIGLIASTVTGNFGLDKIGDIDGMSDQITDFLESL